MKRDVFVRHVVILGSPRKFAARVSRNTNTAGRRHRCAWNASETRGVGRTDAAALSLRIFETANQIQSGSAEWNRVGYTRRWRMIFVVFSILSFIVLRLTVRARWRTLLLLAVVIGLIGDFVADLLVAFQR
jgi:hypothetical protein